MKESISSNTENFFYSKGARREIKGHLHILRALGHSSTWGTLALEEHSRSKDTGILGHSKDTQDTFS